MSTDFFDQGLEWLMNKKEKVEKIFNNIEGFNRMAPENNILGDPNKIPPISNRVTYSSTDALNKMEQYVLDLSSNALTQNISDYSKAYKKLNVKRNEYLGDAKNYPKNRNYNIFVNRLSDLATIKSSTAKCVTQAANNDKYALQNTGSTTFTVKKDTIQACSIIASDSNMPYYAIKKNTSGVYTCSLGASGPAPNSNYTKPLVSYTLQSSEKATKAGLFMNGQIGIYNDFSGNKTDISATAIPAAGANCNPWVGGAINKSSIQATYGKNQSNMAITPKKVKKLVYKISQNSSTNNTLEISRIAVYATVNGRSENVANKIANNDSIVINGGTLSSAGKLIPIKPNLINTNYPDIYHSATTAKNNTWILNLDKEYDVFRVVFFNRLDCCQDRAIGNTITLYNEKGDMVQEFTLDSEFIQTFNLV